VVTTEIAFSDSDLGQLYKDYKKGLDHARKSVDFNVPSFNEIWSVKFARALESSTGEDSSTAQIQLELMALYTSLGEYDGAISLSHDILKNTQDQEDKQRLLMNLAEIACLKAQLAPSDALARNFARKQLQDAADGLTLCKSSMERLNFLNRYGNYLKQIKEAEKSSKVFESIIQEMDKIYSDEALLNEFARLGGGANVFSGRLSLGACANFPHARHVGEG